MAKTLPLWVTLTNGATRALMRHMQYNDIVFGKQRSLIYYYIFNCIELVHP